MHEPPTPDPADLDQSSQKAGHTPGLTPVERLEDTDLADLVARLLVVAKGMYRYQLRSYRSAPKPRDLVQQAITDVLDGTRSWPLHVDAYTMLCGVMRSHVSNFASRQRPVGHSRKKRRAGEGTRHVSIENSPEVSTSQDFARTPDAQLLDEELQDHIRHLVAGDDELEQMVEVLFGDPECSAADLADELGITVREVYNARKRLRRRLETLGS